MQKIAASFGSPIKTEQRVNSINYCQGKLREELSILCPADHSDQNIDLIER